jgi:cytochrome P450
VTGRYSTTEVEVMGKVFPTKTIFLAATSAVNQSEEYYPDHETFNPDRWESNNSPPFFPFGDGPHNCPGQKMAMFEMKVIQAERRSFWCGLSKGSR